MKLFQHRSIRRDLIVIIMSISLLSILLTSISISYMHYRNLKNALIDDLQVAVQTSSIQNYELLPYANVANVQRKIFSNLHVLLNNPAIRLACLYNKQQELVAYYDAADHVLNNKASAASLSDIAFQKAAKELLFQYQQECPKEPSFHMGLSEDVDSISLQHPVYSAVQTDGNKSAIGAFYIEAEVDYADNQMLQQLLTTAIVSAGALVISYLLACKLQQSISKPIQLLSQAASNITIYKDYSVRVAKNSQNYSYEINELIDHFNVMLKEVGDRDSKLMRKNVELERAKEMAESANMSKSQFLANISHELRTPLNAIIGFSSIIVNQLFGPIGNDKYLDYGKDIHESGVHLLDIINDILDLSKAEAGKLGLRLEAFDTQEALNKCMHILSERAAEGEIRLNMNLPHNLPFMIADRVRFIQIMLNLLSNAIKFTEAGGRVDLTVKCEKAGDEVHYFTFTIEDNGIGMRKADIDMAFETFGQVDSGLDRRFEGTGLGLPLTKKLVELHNGSIRIDSQLHKGTTVSIRFISDKALLS